MGTSPPAYKDHTHKTWNIFFGGQDLAPVQELTYHYFMSYAIYFNINKGQELEINTRPDTIFVPKRLKTSVVFKPVNDE